MESSSKGKLLASTRSATLGRKVSILVIAAILLFFSFYLMANEKLMYEMARDLLGNVFLGNLLRFFLPMFFVAYAAYGVIVVFLRGKSYVDVYERVIEGVTEYDLKNSSGSLQKFSIRSDELTNVSEAKNSIQIFTSYATFKVAAAKNRAQAVQALRAKLANGR